MILGTFLLLFGGIVCLLLYMGVGSDQCFSDFGKHVPHNYHTCTSNDHTVLYLGFGLVFFIGLILFIGGLARLYAKTIVTIDKDHIQVQYKQRFQDTTPKSFDKKNLHLSIVDNRPNGDSTFGSFLKIDNNSNE
ncbi:MAG: hypothetical protein J6A01_09120, partial [Proteobacteria bacterium]|nr:hypothetical protein [Pseudomonadota bacterium]